MKLLPRDTPLCFPNQRIGLLGGSFDPPHSGHIDASLHALKRLQLDFVWWLVTPGNPLKSNDALAPLSDRIALCRELIDDRRIVVTGIEQHLANPFTVDTIAHLLVQRPGVRFVWLMGGDSLVNFSHWRDWTAIMSALPIAVIDRPGWRLAAMSSRAATAYATYRLPEHASSVLSRLRPPAWTYLTVPQNPASSTNLRHIQPRQAV